MASHATSGSLVCNQILTFVGLLVQFCIFCTRYYRLFFIVFRLSGTAPFADLPGKNLFVQIRTAFLCYFVYMYKKMVSTTFLGIFGARCHKKVSFYLGGT